MRTHKQIAFVRAALPKEVGGPRAIDSLRLPDMAVARRLLGMALAPAAGVVFADVLLKQRCPQPRLAAPDKLFLGDLVSALAAMEAGIDPRPAGDRCSLASGGVQVALNVVLVAFDLCGKKIRQQGIAQSYLSHGRRKSNLGRAAHPR